VSAMGKPCLAIPAYDAALRSLMSSIVDDMIGVDPVLGQIHSRTTGHAGPTRNVPGPHPVDHDLTHFEAEYAIHVDHIRDTEVDVFIIAICGVAEKYAEAMGAAFVRTVSDVAEAVGNAIDAEGKPFTWDFFLDGLETMEVAFDEDGQYRLQVLINPETWRLLQPVEQTPEQEQRFREIMQRKKDAWDAQQRPRRLPRREQGAGA
jgi:hypothetical protein